MTIEKLFSTGFPTMYHYTTLEAFKSIIRSHQFWASHYSKLNDTSELRRSERIIEARMFPVIKKYFKDRALTNQNFSTRIINNGGIDAVVKSEVLKQSRNLRETTFGSRGFSDIFICSFCFHSPSSPEAEHGLLSQWRGYGADGGVAIEVDTLELERLMDHERSVYAHPVLHVGDVVYDRPGEESNIHVKLEKVLSLLPNLLGGIYNLEPTDETHDILEEFIFGTTLVKHYGFQEESEVRIVIAPTPNNESSIFYEERAVRKPIRYRRKGDTEVSYIELFGQEPLPIKRVIVGPSRYQNTNYQAVCDCVVGRDIQVVKSETPYRG